MTEMTAPFTDTMNMPAQKRTRWKLALKITIVVALLAALGHKGALSLTKTSQAILDYPNFLPAMGLQLVALVLGFIRWQWLLRAQDIHLPFRRTVQLGLIGNFFNVALPGAVSGDLVKAYYVGHEVAGKRARAFGAILFDRVVGLSALVMVSAGALTFGFEKFRGTALIHGVRVVMILAAVGVISFYSYLFTVKEHHDPLLLFIRKLEGRMPRMGSFTRIYEGIRHYHHHPIAVAGVLGISIVIHLLVGLSCLYFVRALGDPLVQLLSVYVIVPLGLLVTAVPIAPAGIGTGHYAFQYLFSLIGSLVGPDAYSLYALSLASWAAVGGFIYLRFKSRPQH
jgi:uncharacterized protein (TIRG00374 family)